MRASLPLRVLVVFALLGRALVGIACPQQPPGGPQENKPLILHPIPARAPANGSEPIEVEHLRI
jgi:hypothetical protein